MKIIRIFFEKKEEAAYISHLDLQRVMARALRKSGLPVWYSQGFNPHIYISFSLPLPLMQHSITESMDCKTESELEDFSAFLTPLNEALPKGIRATKIAVPVYGVGDIAFADYTITYPDEKTLEKAVQAYNSLPKALVLRKTKRSEQEVDLKEYVKELQLQANGSIGVRLPAGGALNYNPELLLRVLGEVGGVNPASATVLRTGVYTKELVPFC